MDDSTPGVPLTMVLARQLAALFRSGLIAGSITSSVAPPALVDGYQSGL